jgi:hypothetical protein
METPKATATEKGKLAPDLCRLSIEQTKDYALFLLDTDGEGLQPGGDHR